jgi:hypothetical protein
MAGMAREQMKNQQDYEIEASERTKNHQPSEEVIIENAYRRGYYQGYAAAIDGGASQRTHLYRYLHKWRYAVHEGKMVEPPMCK